VQRYEEKRKMKNEERRMYTPKGKKKLNIALA
jgi:hypothetical protein